MRDNKLGKFDSLISEKKSGWLEKAKWREVNEDWLDLSFEIAVNILEALRNNKEMGIYPQTQKELVEAMNCSPQYINKVLRGKENLQLGTITKIGKILEVSLVEVPKTKEETCLTSFDYSDDSIYSNLELRLPKVKINWDAMRTTKTSVEKIGISYSSLRERYNSGDDFEDNPKPHLSVA